MMMTLTTRIMMTMMMMMMTLSDRHLWIRTLRYHFWTSLPLCSQYRGQAPLKMRLILMFRVYRYQYTTLILIFYDAHLHKGCFRHLFYEGIHGNTSPHSQCLMSIESVENWHFPSYDELTRECILQPIWHLHRGSLSFHKEAAFSNTPSHEKGLW